MDTQAFKIEGCEVDRIAVRQPLRLGVIYRLSAPDAAPGLLALAMVLMPVALPLRIWPRREIGFQLHFQRRNWLLLFYTKVRFVLAGAET
jgi:hypothetical protein